MQLAELAEKICRARRRRDHILPEIAWMLREPAWDMLLDLFAATVRGKQTSVSSACIATRAAMSTALRWLIRLEQCDAVNRSPDPKDARRDFVQLRPATFDAIALWLDSLRTSRVFETRGDRMPT